MMYIKALSGLLVCCTLLSAAESQVVITDAAPTEFPHIVKIMYQDYSFKKTAPGVFVSAKYVLTSVPSYGKPTKDSFQVTDQLGAVLTPVDFQADADNLFSYMKFCNKYRGTPLNMSESSFDSLTTTVAAQMLFFNTSSNTLKKVSVSLLDNTTCQAKASAVGLNAASYICMSSNVTTNFCRDTYKDAASTYIRYSVVAIGGQVNGLLYRDNCNGDDLTADAPYFFHSKLSYYRQDIFHLIPSVDIV